jgi:hypothetical protein
MILLCEKRAGTVRQHRPTLTARTSEVRMAFMDITGQRFSRLVVLDAAPSKRAGKHWLCVCDCGNETVVRSDHLRYGKTRSCGCYNSEVAKERQTVHGGNGSRLYNIWQHMRGRCERPTDAAFDRYGGRGITICVEWRDFATFAQWAAENGYSDGLSIDRIDNDAGYFPSNCRWASAKTQSRNRGDYNNILTYQGKTACLAEHAEDAGISATTVWERIYRRGWPVERALTERPKNTEVALA